MQGIPDVKDTDAEDVVWGLQTAASLWKRGERIDALVWLRRAAQAAGEANDDDRALELARYAAELSDWMATLPPGSMSEIPPANVNAQRTHAPSGPAFAQEAPTYVPGRNDATQPPADSEPRSIDVLVPVEVESSPHPVFPPPAPSSKRPRGPKASARPQPPPSRPPSQPTMQTPEPTFDRTPHPSQPEEEHSASVPPADKVHAGMFNPWDESATPSNPDPIPSSAPVRTTPPRAPSKAPSRPRAPEEGVMTSVRPQAPSKPAPPAGASKPAPPRPPPLPPRAKAPKPPAPRTSSPSETRVQVAPSAPPPVGDAPPTEDVPPAPTTDEELGANAPTYERAPDPPPLMTPVPPSPTQQMDVEERERLRRASLPPGVVDGRITRTDDDEVDGRVRTDPPVADETPGVAMPDFSAPPPPLVESQMPPAQLDLENVDAFADLPDDARAAFAAAATLSELRESEEVSHFALAYVLRGAFDVSATMVDAPAVQIQTGAVLRARGTTEEGVPMRLVCASANGGLVATWSDAAVDEAFRTIPWVEEDLRAAADRVQTLVGITIGPLGERLDVSIREQIVGRLQMKQVLAGEIVVTEGEVVPGLLLVGVGELELVRGDQVTGTVSSGDFLFATEVLGAGNAPATARAGAGGALVLFGDRTIAQELLVTCPPLLEVFAGM